MRATLAAGALALTAWACDSPAASQARPPQAASSPLPAKLGSITGIGRLMPRKDVRRIAGPSDTVVVISELLVDDGDRVAAGQLLAVLDTRAVRAAAVARREAELRGAQQELGRQEALFRDQLATTATLETLRRQVEAAASILEEARSELARSEVRSPIAGQVLKVHARAGERVGAEGILEVAETHHMYAIAEIYETDVTRVRPGQRATVTSSALAQPLLGTVERVGLKIGKKDVLDADPAAKTDARVVEVEIRLDDSRSAAGLTHLQVEVAIVP